MPVISIDLHQNSKMKIYFPLMKLSINPIASKMNDASIRSMAVDCVYIAVYIGLIQ